MDEFFRVLVRGSVPAVPGQWTGIYLKLKTGLVLAIGDAPGGTEARFAATISFVKSAEKDRYHGKSEYIYDDDPEAGRSNVRGGGVTYFAVSTIQFGTPAGMEEKWDAIFSQADKYPHMFVLTSEQVHTPLAFSSIKKLGY